MMQKHEAPRIFQINNKKKCKNITYTKDLNLFQGTNYNKKNSLWEMNENIVFLKVVKFTYNSIIQWQCRRDNYAT